MNWDQLEGRWNEFAGSARAHWSKLTGDDWQMVASKREQLVERIEQRYGVASQEAERQIEEWSSAVTDFVLVPKRR